MHLLACACVCLRVCCVGTGDAAFLLYPTKRPLLLAFSLPSFAYHSSLKSAGQVVSAGSSTSTAARRTEARFHRTGACSDAWGAHTILVVDTPCANKRLSLPRVLPSRRFPSRASFRPARSIPSLPSRPFPSHPFHPAPSIPPFLSARSIPPVHPAPPFAPFHPPTPSIRVPASPLFP